MSDEMVTLSKDLVERIQKSLADLGTLGGGYLSAGASRDLKGLHLELQEEMQVAGVMKRWHGDPEQFS